MKLHLYLAQNELSATAFAAKVGVPPSTISRILNGSRSPRLSTIAAITAATGGHVTVGDFVSGSPPCATDGATAAACPAKSPPAFSQAAAR